MKSIIYFLLLLIPSVTNAVTFQKDDLKLDVNGYVGYKYIISSEQNTTIPSEPELGLMLSLQLHDYFSMYTQFKYDEDIEDALVYSFASFDYPITSDSSISIKAGKLRHSLGLYNDLRVSPRTRPQIIMPQGYYWDVLGTILTSGVGVRFDVKWKNLEVSYSITDPVIREPKEDAKVWAGALLDKTDTKFGDAQIGYIKYSDDEVPITLKSAFGRFNLGNQSSALYKYLLPTYAAKDTIFYLFTNSVEYTWKDLTLTGEYLLVKGTLNDWDNVAQWSSGYLLSAKYELTNYLSVYTNYNQYNTHIPGLPPFPQALAVTSDINGGINYHRDDWQIGLEAHRIQGARWMNADDYKSDPNGYDTWWMVGMNFVYFF